MPLPFIIIVAVLLGGLPLAYCSVLCIRRWGVGLWLFSPVPSYAFAYLVSFGFVPLIQNIFGVKIYETFYIDEQTMLASQALGILSCWAFSFGFLAYDRPANRTIEPPNPETIAHAEARSLVFQRVSFAFCILMQAAFLAFLFSVRALTTNFGDNRSHYLDAMLGAGYMNLINQLSANILMVGLLYSLWTRRIGKAGVLALLMFIVSNFMITNRGIITSIFYLILLTYFLRLSRTSKKVSPLRLAAMLAVIVGLGSLIGLSRGIGAAEASDDPKSAMEVAIQSFPPVIRGGVFLCYTFDMGVMLEKTISRTDHYQFGASWLEDIGFTFLPRAIFPEKPLIYGASRLQEEVAPEIYGGDVSVSATYPIGIFGEAYINFGVPGVAITLCVLGVILKSWYSRCLQLAHDRTANAGSLFTMAMYASLGSNALPYIRSFGAFVSLAIFMSVLLALTLMAIEWVSRALLGRAPARAAQPDAGS